MPLWSVNRHRQNSSRSNDSLRFRHRPYAFDTSSVVPLRSSFRQSPDLVLSRPFPSALTTMAFDHSRRRWFGTRSCKPVPRGLPSSVKQLRTTRPRSLSRSWRTVVGKPEIEPKRFVLRKNSIRPDTFQVPLAQLRKVSAKGRYYSESVRDRWSPTSCKGERGTDRTLPVLRRIREFP